MVENINTDLHFYQSYGFMVDTLFFNYKVVSLFSVRGNPF